MIPTRRDYLYCETCECVVDFWKYDHDLEAAGHEGHQVRELTEEEYVEALENCLESGCLDEGRTLFVLVGLCQGVVDEVSIHNHLDRAKEAYKEYTGQDYEVLENWIKDHGRTDYDLVQGHYEGSQIHEAEIA